MVIRIFSLIGHSKVRLVHNALVPITSFKLDLIFSLYKGYLTMERRCLLLLYWEGMDKRRCSLCSLSCSHAFLLQGFLLGSFLYDLKHQTRDRKGGKVLECWTWN